MKAFRIDMRPADPGNYSIGRFGHGVERIVVHLMDGSMEGTAAWFADPRSRVSAHYGVGLDGRVAQYVGEQDTAWHAGVWASNLSSVGIEHEGRHPAGGDWAPSAAQLDASARLAAEVCARHGIAPSSETIVPHSSINPRKPRCPGPGFPLEEYIRRVRTLMFGADGEVVPVRLFDPARNEQIGAGSWIRGTDKVYVKRLGPVPAEASQSGGAEMRKAFDSLWNGGWLGKAVLAIIAVAVLALLIGVARGQEVSVLDPSSWFTSVEAVMLIGGVIAGYVTKLATALGKDWFRTEGQGTVILSGFVSVVIGGVGGWLALGAFGSPGGLQGAVYAAGMVLIAFLGSNGSAKAERQAMAGAAKRLDADFEAAKAKTL